MKIWQNLQTEMWTDFVVFGGKVWNNVAKRKNDANPWILLNSLEIIIAKVKNEVPVTDRHLLGGCVFFVKCLFVVFCGVKKNLSKNKLSEMIEKNTQQLK